MALIDARSQQRFFESNFRKLRKGGNKSEEQNETIASLYKYYNTQEKVI